MTKKDFFTVNTNNKNKNSYASFFSFTTICAVAFTFAFISISRNIFIDTDTGWLLQCLQRFLAGGTYTKNFFETNPPLSFLIYFPVLSFLKFDANTIKLALILTFLGYAFISDTLTYLLLKRSNLPTHVITTSMLAILFAQTWGMGILSMTRDALVFYCLIPLCIAQYSITKNTIQSKSLLFLSSLIGAIGICIKPHYATIPLAFFLHRYFSQKKLCPIIKSIDFITILLTAITYLFIVIVFFPDFLKEVIPHVLSIYYVTPALPLLDMAFFLIFSLFSLLLVGFFNDATSYKKEFSSIINMSVGLGFLCFLSFLMQGKGFLYQALPFLGFTAIALFISVSTILSNFVARKYTCIWITYISLSILCLPLLTGFTNSPFLTHKKFKDIDFFEKINQLSPNHTFINYDFKPNYLALPYYYDLKNVSRFGILWPIDGLNQLYEIAETEEEKDIIKSKFTFFIEILAEDIETGKPDVICIPRYPPIDTDIPEQRLLPFLLKNTSYAKAFENYEFKEHFVYEKEQPSFGKKHNKIDKITFDLYTRKVTAESNTPENNGSKE